MVRNHLKTKKTGDKGTNKATWTRFTPHANPAPSNSSTCEISILFWASLFLFDLHWKVYNVRKYEAARVRAPISHQLPAPRATEESKCWQILWTKKFRAGGTLPGSRKPGMAPLSLLSVIFSCQTGWAAEVGHQKEAVQESGYYLASVNKSDKVGGSEQTWKRQKL